MAYPLYVVHLPIVFVHMSWAAAHPEISTSVHVMAGVFTLFISCLVAYASLRLYDEPLRKYLTERMKHKCNR